MIKQKNVYICQNCGFQLPKWLGKCPECEEWNTIEEEVISDSIKDIASKVQITEDVLSLDQLKSSQYSRISSGIKEIDRVLGGGVVEGAVTLIGGEPGIGKTTILYQLLDKISSKDYKSLYVSGEESVQQAKLRLERLSINSSHVHLVSQTSLEIIKAYIDKVSPKIVVIDSIQVISSGILTSSPGTISHIREAVSQLTYIAKTRGIAIFLVGHITKVGSFAGPKLLEHMVDTVLYFGGERYSNYRMIKCVKNRFGSTDEIAFFDMTAQGLKEVENPSEIFISEKPNKVPGSIIVPVMEGTRAILVEVQALVTDANFSTPIRRTSGIDYNRVSVLIAVLEKRARLKLRGMDVFVKVAGGIKIQEPATDLATSIVIASSFKNKSIRNDVIAIGEVGLGGEIRTVTNINQRIKEASKVGFKSCVLAANYKSSLKNIKGINLEWVHDINQAIELLLR